LAMSESCSCDPGPLTQRVLLTLSYAGMTQIRFEEYFSAARPGGTSSSGGL